MTGNIYADVGVFAFFRECRTPALVAATSSRQNAIVAGSLVAIIPLIIAFLLLQRYWRGGLTIGALK